jgi:hypothetical protein
VAKYAHLVPPKPVPNDKAIWIIAGTNTTIENIEFSDAWIDTNKGGNAAGIRQEAANVTIRNCYFHECQNGILESNVATSNVIIEATEFARCGNDSGPDAGYTHNLYIGHVASFTLKNCYSHGAKQGHLVKTRAKTNHILYNRLTDEAGTTASYELSFPDGGNTYAIGNIIEQSSTSANSGIVDYASEHIFYPDAKKFYFVNNTVVNDRGSGNFVQIGLSGVDTVKIANNLFVGSGGFSLKGMLDTSHNIVATNAAFVNQATYDYHLTSASPGINKGIDPGSADGFSLMPVFQYVHPMSNQARTAVGGVIDIGAYEYGTAAVVFPKANRKALEPDNKEKAIFFSNGRKVDKKGVNLLHEHRFLEVIIDSKGHQMIGI